MLAWIQFVYSGTVVREDARWVGVAYLRRSPAPKLRPALSVGAEQYTRVKFNGLFTKKRIKMFIQFQFIVVAVLVVLTVYVVAIRDTDDIHGVYRIVRTCMVKRQDLPRLVLADSLFYTHTSFNTTTTTHRRCRH